LIFRRYLRLKSPCARERISAKIIDSLGTRWQKVSPTLRYPKKSTECQWEGAPNY